MAIIKSVVEMRRKPAEVLDTLRWILERLKGYEEKYGMNAEEFINAWKSGKLEEPEDFEVLSDFLNWEADYEMLQKTLKRVRDIVQSS